MIVVNEIGMWNQASKFMKMKQEVSDNKQTNLTSKPSISTHYINLSQILGNGQTTNGLSATVVIT